MRMALTAASCMNTDAIVMDDFLVRAVLAGVGVAAVTGPLGSFVVWRRMSFFGDALAHSALLGVALGLLLGIDLTVGVLAVAVIAAISLLGIERRTGLAMDTVLGILSHGTLAIGLVAVAFLERVRFDLLGFLFGDILAVTAADIAWIYGGGAVALALIAYLWRPLLSATVHADLARAEGVPVDRVNLVFLLCLALVVATAMKVVGILLVAAMLIIPAATARPYSRTPERMAVFAVVISWLSVAGGLGLSFAADTPGGPSIISFGLLLFALTTGLMALRQRHSDG